MSETCYAKCLGEMICPAKNLRTDNYTQGFQEGLDLKLTRQLTRIIPPFLSLWLLVPIEDEMYTHEHISYITIFSNTHQSLFIIV